MAGLILGEGLGVPDEVGGLVDEAFGLVSGIAQPRVEAFAMQERLPSEVTVMQ